MVSYSLVPFPGPLPGCLRDRPKVVTVQKQNIVYYEIFLEIPTAHSLKDKRGFLKGPLERIRRKLNVAIVEAGQHDTWNEATVAVVTLGTSESVINHTLKLILKELEDSGGIVIRDWTEERL